VEFPRCLALSSFPSAKHAPCLKRGPPHADHHLPFDNTYARDLPGFYEPWQPATVRQPVLLFFNRGLAEELRLGLEGQDDTALANLFAGNTLPEGAQPIAQAYAGHQFGQFNPQLGDGRALLIGEVIDRLGRRRDIAFKGSGRTPFSRRGDGKAAVGPMLREVLIGEAMQALGIPTTRALAVVSTGEPVFRERTLPGAILTRVAASHLRVGTFSISRPTAPRSRCAGSPTTPSPAITRKRGRPTGPTWPSCPPWPSARRR
jgi:uncharacterized protein YdiU (UPF0061 family)